LNHLVEIREFKRSDLNPIFVLPLARICNLCQRF